MLQLEDINANIMFLKITANIKTSMQIINEFKCEIAELRQKMENENKEKVEIGNKKK